MKGFRYLGFIQSEVFDAPQNIDNCRKEIKNIIKTEEQAYKDIEKVRNLSLFGDFILQEDLENAVKREFYNLFPDAKEKENEKQQKLKELKDLFGLENNSRITIKTSDSEKDILEKFYRSDSLKQATMDAILKDVFDQLKTLDSNDPEYEKKFEELSNDLNRKIPLRNKNCLSKYMSGRRVALEYFRMALDKELDVQKTKVKGKRNMEEHRLHNSLLKRKCANTSKSNLWMLNDEFIYFTGFSDVPLNQMKNEKGEDIFDFANVTEEERALLENRDDDKPDIILFDEPMSALDADNRLTLRKELKNIQKKLKTTMIYITHDQEEAFSLSDRVMVMNNGKIEQLDTPNVIFNKPKNDYVKKFVVNHLIEKVSSIEKCTGIDL